MSTWENSTKRRLRVTALACLAVATLGPSAAAEEKFQKLTGGQIRAKLAGMELTSKSYALISIAVVFFIAYWVIAGPGMYLFLVTRTRAQLSWFMFAASARKSSDR